MRRNTHPSGARARTRAASLARWLVYAPALLIFTTPALAFLEHGARIVTFAYQIDYGEVPELNRALLLARGQQIYVDPSALPYQMANYTPLYPALVSLFVRFTGPDFFPGRAISLAATLVSAGLLAVTVRALGAPMVGATLAALLWLAQHPVWRWGAYQRVDPLAVGLELAALTFFCAGWVRTRQPWAVWLSVPLFLAAAFTRQ